MLSREYIESENRKAALKAAREKRFPFVVTEQDVAVLRRQGAGFKFPFIGDWRPRGWKLIDQYFVDSSGMGSEGEPALTSYQFAQKLKVGYGYALLSCGQFQVYVGEFIPPKSFEGEKAKATLAEKVGRELDGRIARYIEGFVKDVEEHGPGAVNGGDCWGCLFGLNQKITSQFGQVTIGTLTKGGLQPPVDASEPMGLGHYRDHFADQYYVRSLLAKAAAEAGEADYRLLDPVDVRRVLIAFFRRRRDGLLKLEGV